MLLLNSDGSFQYSAKSGFVGVDTFTYRASDGQLQSAPVTITIVVGLPPVNPTDGSAGSGSTGGGSSSGSTTSSSSTDNSSTTSSSSTTQPTDTTAPAAPAVVAGVGQDNSRIAERSMEAQQSATAGQSESVGTAALNVSTISTTMGSQVAMAKLGNLTWDPLTVSAVTSRDTIRPREHAWRLDALATCPCWQNAS